MGLVVGAEAVVFARWRFLIAAASRMFVLSPVFQAGDVGATSSTVAFLAPVGDGVLAEDSAARDDAPAVRFQGRIDELSAGIGFVHP